MSTGAQVVSVVPQPITRQSNYLPLTQATDTVDVYFNQAEVLGDSAQDTSFYRLFEVNQQTGEDLGSVIVPAEAKLPDNVLYPDDPGSYTDTERYKVTLIFSAHLRENSLYRLEVGEPTAIIQTAIQTIEVLETPPTPVPNAPAVTPLGSTDIRRPIFSGTGQANAIVTLLVDLDLDGAPEAVLGSPTVSPNGTWTATPAVDLPEGPVIFAAFQTDSFGQVSPLTHGLVDVDLSNPAEPVVESLDPQPTQTPTIEGTGEPGASVTIVRNGFGQVGNGTVGANGEWSVQVDPLPEGDINLSISLTDAAGNSSTLAPLVVRVLVTPLPAPILVLAQATWANQRPPITGTGVAGNTIQVRADLNNDGNFESILGTTAVAPNDSWRVSPAVALPEGTWNIRILHIDEAGNQSLANGQITIDQSSLETLTVNPPGLQSNVLPTISGTSDAAVVVLKADLNSDGVVDTEVGRQTVGNDGTWSLTPDQDFPQGSVAIEVTHIDSAGNEGPTDIAGLAPVVSQVEIDSIVLDPTVDSPAITNTTTPTIEGTGEVGATVTVAADVDQVQPGLEILGEPVVQSDGSWSLDLSATAFALPVGATQLEVHQTDLAGNVSAPDVVATITVDQEISTPVINAHPVTNNLRPTITGTGDIGATVTLSADIDPVVPGVETVIDTALVQQDGSWSVTPTTDLPTQLVQLEAFQTDSAGNVSGAGLGQVEIDQNDLAPVVDALPTTNNATPDITGTGEEGAAIVVLIDTNDDGVADEVLGSVTVGVDTTWTVTPAAALPDGTYPLVVYQVYPSGQISQLVTAELNIDLVAPIGLFIEPPANTNNPTPTISGRGEAGATVTLTADVDLDGSGSTETTIGTTTVGADGTWSKESDVELPHGKVAIEAVQTDAVGNESNEESVEIDVFRNLPNAPVISSPQIIDEFITDSDSPTIAGTGEPGHIIQLRFNFSDLIDGTTTDTTAGWAEVDVDGNWSIDLASSSFTLPTGSSPNGANITMSATQTDPFGNESLPEPEIGSIRVDVFTPESPAFDGFDASTGFLPPTSSITPTVSGTGEPDATVRLRGGPSQLDMGFATVGPDGTWSITSTVEFGDGNLSLSITQTDEAGRVSSPSLASIEIDTVAPASPTINAISKTRDTRPYIKGSGDVGATVSVFADINLDLAVDTDPAGPEFIGTAVVGADGLWDLFPNQDFPEAGTVALEAFQTDQVGNQGPVGSGSVQINPAASPLPPTLIAGPGSTQVEPDVFPTGQATPIIYGRGFGGATVTIKVDVDKDGSYSQELGTVTLGANADEWQIQYDWANLVPPILPNDTYSISYTQAVPGAAKSPPNVGSITIDTNAPLKPDCDQDTTPTLTSLSSMPVFTGQGEVNALVTISANLIADPSDAVETVIGTAIVQPDGSWSVSSDSRLPVSTVKVGVAQTDNAGNTSDSLLFDVDVFAADPLIDAPNPTSNVNPIITGTGEPGATISLKADIDGDAGTPLETIGTSTVAEDGTWSVTSTEVFDEGTDLSLEATQTPAGETTATASGVITVDTTQPDAPVITPFSAPQNTTLPTISGTGVDGHTVSVLVDLDGDNVFETVVGNAVVGQVTPSAWSLNANQQLPEGTYQVRATQTDSAGNTSDSSALVELVIDTTAPFSLTAEPLAQKEIASVVGTVPTTGAYDVVLSSDGTTAYVADSTSGLQIIDLATEAVTGTVPTTNAVGVLLSTDGMTAYVADRTSGLQIIDLATEAVTGTVPTTDAQRVVLSLDGTTAYVADRTSGLQIIDLATEAVAGTVSTTNAYEVVLSLDGTTAYVADGTSGLQIIDLAAEAVIGTVATAGFSYDVVLSADGTTAYVANGTSGLQIIDLAAEAAIGTIATAGNAVAVVLSIDGTTAYVAHDTSGLQIIDLATEAVTQTIDTTARANDVALSSDGTVAYVADVDTGLQIIAGFAVVGTGDAGATVTAKADTDNDPVTPLETIGTSTVGADGSWTIRSTSSLADGEYDISIIQTDAAGNTGPEQISVILVDTVTPSAPVIDVLPVTNDPQPILTGTGESGATVTLTADVDPAVAGDEIIGVAVVQTNGNWSVQLNQPIDGTVTIAANQVDGSGNESESSFRSIEIDENIPNAPEFTTAAATNDTSKIEGTGEEGATVIVLFDDDGDGTPDAVLGQAVVGSAPDLKWEITPTQAFDEGVHVFVAYQVDEAGNTSARAVHEVEFDTTSPDAPTIDSLPIASTENPVITGTGEPDATVTVKADIDNDAGTALVSIGTATVALDGTWSIPSTEDFVDGTALSLEATQQDPAGNSSDPVTGVATGVITVDTTEPQLPVINVQTTATNDATPLITGTGEPGAIITLQADDDNDAVTPFITIGTATVEIDGTWQLAPVLPVVFTTDADIALEAVQEDAVGNTSNPGTGTIKID